MSFIGTGLMVGAGVEGGMGLLGSLGAFGKPKQVQYNAPSYYNDPNYAASTNSLMPFASSLMSGQGLPSAYQDLMTPNSPQFQAMLARTTGNILSSTQSAMASQGIGDSGVALSAESQAVGDATAQLSYADYQNSLANQLQLMTLGTNTMGNLGSMALENQGQQNQFNLTNAAAESGVSAQNVALDNQAQANWGSMMGSGLSSLGNIYGMSQLNSSIQGLGNQGFNPNQFANFQAMQPVAKNTPYYSPMSVN